MVGEDRESNGDGVICGGGVVKYCGDVANGFPAEVENGTAGNGNSAITSCAVIQTYKRRRYNNTGSLDARCHGDEKIAANSICRLPDKVVEDLGNGVLCSNSLEQISSPRMDSHPNGSDTCPLNRWRKIVLEQMYQSVCEAGDGLQGCVQDALLFHPESGYRPATKELILSCNETHNSPSQINFAVNGAHTSKVNGATMSNGLLSESNTTNSDLCRRAFFDLVMSENFAQLCRLLVQNFQGIKVDSLLELSLANSRMKEGAYERSPMLFHSDMQRIWTKLQKVGAEMVVLAKSLSEKLRTSYCQQQFLTGDLPSKSEQTEAVGGYTLWACQCCGENADGRDRLVCDSCEEMYHVSCIEPAVKEIPSKSWYCAKCMANGVESPHDNCVVCEKLNASRLPINDPANDESFAELSENSNSLAENGLQQLKGGKNLHRCNICRIEVDKSENFRVCGHPFCPHKYYHVRCLTRKQRNIHGPCWYCPSCLCRSCLTDRDDEKIVLCDGCDNAYHIYCMRPPRTSIPRGKWFCRKCHAGIQRIRKAKQAYEKIQNELKKRGEDGRRASGNLENERTENEELIDKSGGVEMLLNAAKTLNYEEKMAAIEKR
ncbi:Histone-lysine N-methyltransferase [Bertholletia excelsa]